MAERETMREAAFGCHNIQKQRKGDISDRGEREQPSARKRERNSHWFYKWVIADLRTVSPE